MQLYILHIISCKKNNKINCNLISSNTQRDSYTHIHYMSAAALLT